MKLLLRRCEVLELLGVSHTTLYDWMAKRGFPRPRMRGMWNAEAIRAWVNQDPAGEPGQDQALRPPVEETLPTRGGVYIPPHDTLDDK